MPDTAVEVATEAKDFDLAFRIANESAKHLTAKVHLKLAAHHEDRGEFGAAEHHFILGKKPSEAVEMYQHLVCYLGNSLDPEESPGQLWSKKSNDRPQ